MLKHPRAEWLRMYRSAHCSLHIIDVTARQAAGVALLRERGVLSDVIIYLQLK